MITKNIFFFIAIWIQKNAEFDADFESVEKAAENIMQKSYQQKSARKMGFLLFLLCEKSFLSHKFFCVTFWHFFQRIRTQHQIWDL
jgi:hypothetical protein